MLSRLSPDRHAARWKARKAPESFPLDHPPHYRRLLLSLREL